MEYNYAILYIIMENSKSNYTKYRNIGNIGIMCYRYKHFAEGVAQCFLRLATLPVDINSLYAICGFILCLLCGDRATYRIV